MLTKSDLLKVEDLIDRKLDEKLEKKFEEKLKYLPSKVEFYEKMDEVMGELKAIREQQELITGRDSEVRETLEDHEERLTKLESTSSVD
jgi:DNA repair exonuclease SbcCD ATPase subunit